MTSTQTLSCTLVVMDLYCMALGFAGVATVPLSFRHFSATLFACPPRLWLCLVRKCGLRAWQEVVLKRWRVAVCALGLVVFVLWC